MTTTCGLGRPGDEERHTSRQGLAGIVCAASSSPIFTPETQRWLWQVSIQNNSGLSAWQHPHFGAGRPAV